FAAREPGAFTSSIYSARETAVSRRGIERATRPGARPQLRLPGARRVSLMSDNRGGALVVGDRRQRPDLVVAAFARLGLALERELEHLVDPLHRDDLELVLDVVRDLDQVLHVLLGDQHGLDAAAVRRQ